MSESPYSLMLPQSSVSFSSLTVDKLFFTCLLANSSGAFKFRGACNAVLSLDAEQAAKGVVTHSRFFLVLEILMICSAIVVQLDGS